MNKNLYRTAALTLAGAVQLAGCGGGGGTPASSPGGDVPGSTGSGLDLLEVSNGFGPLLPHRVRKLDEAGVPTGQIVAITEPKVIADNVVPGNPILPPTAWDEDAVLPGGQAGNHFLVARFGADVDPASFLALGGGDDPAPWAGAITAVAVDPATLDVTDLPGRVFIDGLTPDGGELVRWIELDGNQPIALDVGGDQPGHGFPGTQAGFSGMKQLVSKSSVVFVADTDGDLSSHETFPAGMQIELRITTALASTQGKALERQALACSTVGADLYLPEVLMAPPPSATPMIVPGGGETGVDPQTSIEVQFSEPVQLASLGMPLYDQPGAPLGSAVRVEFGPPSTPIPMPYRVEPVSVHDLSRLKLVPRYPFPGTGPPEVACSTFGTVVVSVTSSAVADLSGNLNALGPATSFETGEGVGLVNAPVAPEAIYIGLGGGVPGIGVVDLNGNGQGTGNPATDFGIYFEHHTTFVFNPNLVFGASLFPPLTPGACSYDSGGEGKFTRTLSSSLDDRLIRAPSIESVSDMALGWSLDAVFHASSSLTGCLEGVGNPCADTGKKRVALYPGGPNTLSPVGLTPIQTIAGGANPISFAPHPNPPRLTFPVPCLSPSIWGQEPTSIDSTPDLLQPGGSPLGSPPLPPDGSLGEKVSWFIGPSAPKAMISDCTDFMYRQQIGHFLYVADPARSEIVVLNSNRFTVIDRIPVPGPAELAMGPNLDRLAVTSPNANLVSFIDVRPTSPSFHTVIDQVQVGEGPTGIAWDPTNEDILVCNELGGTVSVIAASSFTVRKTLSNQLDSPFDVAITPRQVGFGYNRGVYFAYIMNRNGRVSLFESGPDGPNGIGYDNIIGQTEFVFTNPKAIQPDPRDLGSGVWICHENELGPDGKPTGLTGGAVSNLAIKTAVSGPIPLDPGLFTSPHLRDIAFHVPVSVGSDELTGVPVDLAFDNLRNFGSIANVGSQYSAGTPALTNGKGLVRSMPWGFDNVSEPAYLFLAIPSSNQPSGGVVDVIQLEAGHQRLDVNPFHAGTQSIPAPGVQVLMDYWRQ